MNYFRPVNVTSLTTSVLEKKKKPQVCNRTFGSVLPELKVRSRKYAADSSPQNGAIPASVQRQHLLLISECFLFVINTFEMLISRIFLSGVEWVILNVTYPQVTTKLHSLIMIG